MNHQFVFNGKKGNRCRTQNWRANFLYYEGTLVALLFLHWDICKINAFFASYCWSFDDSNDEQIVHAQGWIQIMEAKCHQCLQLPGQRVRYCSPPIWRISASMNLKQPPGTSVPTVWWVKVDLAAFSKDGSMSISWRLLSLELALLLLSRGLTKRVSRVTRNGWWV